MRIFCFALAIAVFATSAFIFQQNALSIIAWINELGYVAPIFFLLIYCLATILFLPTMVLTLAGGALFGPIIGTIINLLGASLGAACAFCISRYCVADWLAAKKNIRINNLVNGVERRGWQFVAMLRILPIIPFNLINYGLGVTRIKFTHYILTTFIFLIPTEILSTYCGYAGMDMLVHSEDIYNVTNFTIIFCITLLFFFIKYLKRKHRLYLLAN